MEPSPEDGYRSHEKQLDPKGSFWASTSKRFNVKLLKMDVYADDVPDRIVAELGGPANTVLSDLAPSIIGAWDVDHARQVDLARRALEIAEKVLDHHGNVLIKLFEGPERKKLQDDAALYFERSRLLKPKASRPEASEIYFLGLGFKTRWHQPRMGPNG